MAKVVTNKTLTVEIFCLMTFLSVKLGGTDLANALHARRLCQIDAFLLR